MEPIKDQTIIRNFSIIAHIDHGKSTLADRLLELTGTVSAREMTPQYLDKMDLEKERGITIKAQTVSLDYQASDGKNYRLNLIDTPGHMDFSYEVSRSLAACEGALLVVDATQGIEAQTLANLDLALKNKLKIIPVINKIDLPQADPKRVKEEIELILGVDSAEILEVSAKSGKNVHTVLEAIVKRIPAPSGKKDNPLSALIFDSWYDTYQGVIVLIRVFEGKIFPGMRIKLFASNNEYEVNRVGIFSPAAKDTEALSTGEVGFIIAGIKNLRDIQVGDTITDASRPTTTPFPGFQELKPMVFCGVYPSFPEQYNPLREALEKLRLNDSSFTFEPENSVALGFGFHCGFLGLLHKEIIQERLEREFNLDLVSTAPNVVYNVTTLKGDVIKIESPDQLPPPQEIAHIAEPYILASIPTPVTYLGEILKLCEEKRGLQRDLKYLSPEKVVLKYEIPLNEVVWDFNDRLKSLSRGYASFDYEFLDFRNSSMVKLDLLLNGSKIDALSLLVPKEKAYYIGKGLVEKIRKIIPRHLFEVVIQAAIGSKVIARDSIPPLRKNVTAKCYGGDITRKRKLLEKQKEGKKRMKQVGKISIPQEAFLSILKVS